MAPTSSLRDDGLVVGLVNDLTLTFDRGRPVPAETPAELRRRCAGTVHDDVSTDDLEDLRQLAALLRPVFGRGTGADADHAAAIANRLLGGPGRSVQPLAVATIFGVRNVVARPELPVC